MDELIKADIFFFITTIAVIVLTITIVIFVLYMIGIMRNIKDVSEIVKKQVTSISEDMTELRQSLKKEGLKWKNIIQLFTKNKNRTRK